jgi:hypothetical protein
MTPTYTPGSDIKRWWKELSHDAACILFDANKVHVRTVRDTLGDEAATVYRDWICRRVP